MKSILLILGLMMFITISCTDNQLVRQYGGTETIKLNPGERLMNATWKGDQLWYITEPMPEDYVPVSKTFKEKSAYGLVEGKVIFVESR